ncbi:hypothetical protein GOODEAATRI_024754 [Goodea atripinnis]|uniref:Uncharacterized protein n=1 Tax=Goodea atripinnis TaxID=208336 RepID=A0ABV0PGY5_9TELE
MYPAFLVCSCGGNCVKPLLEGEEENKLKRFLTRHSTQFKVVGLPSIKTDQIKVATFFGHILFSKQASLLVSYLCSGFISPLLCLLCIFWLEVNHHTFTVKQSLCSL